MGGNWGRRKMGGGLWGGCQQKIDFLKRLCYNGNMGNV